MTPIDWNASEIRLHLTPSGKPVGRKPRSTSVFKEYGDLRQRAIQAIAGMLDGETVYFSAIDSGGANRGTIPVSGWRNGGVGESLSCVAAFIDNAFATNMKVVCFGASRMKWELKAEGICMTSDVLDNMSDKGLAGDGRATASSSAVEANGIRMEF